MTTLVRTFPPEPPEHLFTVEDYLRMGAVGILTANDHVELIEGRIVQKMARNAPHEASLQRIFPLLLKVLPGTCHVRVQSSLRLPHAESVPEPDLSIIRGTVDQYDAELPQGSDAIMVIEIADSSLYDDRRRKTALYAGASIATYWIVNLVERRVEEYSNPTGPERSPAYKSRIDFAEDQTVPLRLPDGSAPTLCVVDMLPSPRS